MSGGTMNDARDESIGELLKDLTNETSTLVRQELAFARAELTQKGKAAGKGAGMLAAAGVVALLMLGALTASLIALVSTAVTHVWLAALIVTVVYGAIAAVLALTGRRALKDALPPAPQETIENVKEDVAWVKTQTRSAQA
jgi:F0F1-type ATP synthase assembly protein I